MGYRVERLSLLFTCKNCTTNQMFSGDSLDYIIERAKVEGWTLPWKIKNIKPTVYESTEDIFCPACSNRANCSINYKYMIYYPPGNTIIDGEVKSNSDVAKELIESIGKKNIAIPWPDLIGWKIMYFNGKDWSEISPKIEVSHGRT